MTQDEQMPVEQANLKPRSKFASRVGYQRSFNDEDLRKIEIMAGVGLTLKQIAAVLEISEKTIHDYKNGIEEFGSALTRGKAKAAAQVGKALYQRAIGGDVNAIRWYEMTRCGRTEKSRQELTGPNGEALGTSLTVTFVQPEIRSAD